MVDRPASSLPARSIVSLFVNENKWMKMNTYIAVYVYTYIYHCISMWPAAVEAASYIYLQCRWIFSESMAVLFAYIAWVTNIADIRMWLYIYRKIFILVFVTIFFSILTYMLVHIFCICAIYNKYRCLNNNFFDVL